MKKIQELIKEAKQKNIVTVREFLKFLEPSIEQHKDSLDLEFGRVLANSYLNQLKKKTRSIYEIIGR